MSMRRRHLLVAGAIGFTGCSGLGSDGDSQTEAPESGDGEPETGSATAQRGEETTATPAPDRGRRELSTGDAYTTETGLEISVSTLQVGREVVSGNGRVEAADEGSMFVLARCSVSNGADNVQRAPTVSEWGLRSGTNHYETVGAVGMDELTDPVTGPVYSGGEVQPDGQRGGWIVFEVPTETTTVSVAVTKLEAFTIEGVFWHGAVAAENVPDISLASVDAPDRVTVGEDVVVTVRAENAGGSTGDMTLEYEVVGPQTQPSERRTLEFVVNGDSSVSKTISISPQTVGVVKVTVDGESYTTRVVLPRVSFGESWKTPDDVKIEMDDRVLAPRYSYDEVVGELTREASAGLQYLFVRCQFESTGIGATTSPETTLIQAMFGGESYARKVPVITEADEFTAPVEGPPYVPSFGSDLEPDQTRRGWILFEVPNDATRADIDIKYRGQSEDSEYGVVWERK